MMGLMLVLAVLAMATIGSIRRLGRPAMVDVREPLFAEPMELVDWSRPPVPPEPDLAAQIGQVISDGMDRVDAMRQFGADRFLTFMPMPDGTCWSLTVVRHSDEATAKGQLSARPGGHALMTDAPAVPVDYYDLGVQHFLIGLHVPDRMGTSYPTQDRHTPAQEAEFLRGWYDTKRAEEAKFADATELENWSL